MNPSQTRRRFGLSVFAALGALSVALSAGLSGCASPAPRPRLYRLPITPPTTASGTASNPQTNALTDPRTDPLTKPLEPAAPAAPTEVWQLMAPLALPEYLDRDAFVLAGPGQRLLALAGQRWAEPLRDAVPRIVLSDLRRLRGGASVWAWPVPAGVTVARELRIELLAFEAMRAPSRVQLRARWTLTDPSGQRPPRTGVIELAVRSQGSDVDALVGAHRLALWRLALQLAALEPAPL